MCMGVCSLFGSVIIQLLDFRLETSTQQETRRYDQIHHHISSTPDVHTQCLFMHYCAVTNLKLV